MNKYLTPADIQALKGASIVGILATLTSYTIAAGMGWVTISGLNWLEVFAVFTSYICTFLCVKQRRINYPVGVLTTFIYSILFFQWELYAVATFNLYLVGSLVYGWFRWGSDDNPLRVTGFKWIDVPNYLFVGGVIYGLLFAVSHFFGVEISNVEAAVTVFSGIAQFGLDNKRLWNWNVWAVVNLFSIWLYFDQEMYLVAIQYVFFLANTAYGFFQWWDSMKEPSYV